MKKLSVLSLALIFAVGAMSFTPKEKAKRATETPSTESVMKDAYAQAAKEHKKVLVIFHASWCGWCKKMEACINDPALNKLFMDNYVVTYLVTMESKGKENLENPGSKDYMTKYQGDKSGLPFWFIADANGKKLADSQIRPDGAALDSYGESIGCPAEPKEVAYFIKVLKATSKLNDEQLAIISERFAKNKPTPVAKPAPAASSK